MIALDALSQMSLEELTRIEREALSWEHEDRKQNALLYYKPNSQKVLDFHRSTAKTIGIFGGNRSGKTDSSLAEICALATGVIPESLQCEPTFMSKFRGPLKVRIICESLTANLYEVIINKLRWHEWSGNGEPGSDRGHYGWIPKRCLIEGDWDLSYNKQFRILRFKCFDPQNPDKELGESRIQIMSDEQEHHRSAEYHIILMDEPPSYSVWKESLRRVMSVGGRIYLAMTWPDDPSFPIEWLFDEVYDKAQPGPHKDPNIDTFNFYTTENPNIDQAEVAIRAGQMSEEDKQLSIYGQPIRFSNRIMPLFTDQTQHWCFTCGLVVIVNRGICTNCNSLNTVAFNHVEPFDAHPNWPTAHLLDPHPSKPHMGLLIQIDPNDDWWVLDEIILSEDPTEYRRETDDRLQAHKLRISRELMDPNMGGSPAGTNREVTWQTEFNRAGFEFELADDGSPGIATVNGLFKPSKHTQRPRITVHPRCETTKLQLKRWTWLEPKNPDQRGVKRRPDDKHSDMPTLLKYLANDFPTFQGYRGATTPIRYAQGSYTSGSRRTRSEVGLSDL